MSYYDNIDHAFRHEVARTAAEFTKLNRGDSRVMRIKPARRKKIKQLGCYWMRARGHWSLTSD